MSGTTILIVEDDPNTRMALANVFTRKGWDVSIAGSVADGLAALDPVPDCAIVDLRLPDGEGESILQKIRAENIPVQVLIVATGDSDPVRRAKVAKLRPNLMIQKPFDWDIVWRYCLSEVSRDHRGTVTE